MKISIDPEKLYTQSEYGRLIGESPQVIKYWVSNKKVKTLKIKGGVLIIKE